MGRAALGAPAKRGKEGDEDLGGPKGEEPDAASRRPPPQPEGLSAKGFHAASAGLNDDTASPFTRFLACQPFALNAASIDYLDTLLALEDEAQLGALLGHELGHVNARHSASRMSKGMLVQLAAAGATVAVAARNERYAPLAAAAGALGSGLLLAKYSRDDERQADDLGLEYLVKAGHAPSGMTGLMTLLVSLHDREPSRLELMFASHPMGKERLENVRQAIGSRYGSLAAYPANRERYQDALVPLRRFKPVVEAIQRGDRMASKPEEALGHYQAALKAEQLDYEALVKSARTLLALGRAREAAQHAQRAKLARPGEPQAVAALGLADLQLKRYAQARQGFQDYQKVLPGNPGMLFLEGFCEDHLGRKAEAIALYRQYLATGPRGKTAETAQARLLELAPPASK